MNLHVSQRRQNIVIQMIQLRLVFKRKTAKHKKL